MLPINFKLVTMVLLYNFVHLLMITCMAIYYLLQFYLNKSTKSISLILSHSDTIYTFVVEYRSIQVLTVNIKQSWPW